MKQTLRLVLAVKDIKPALMAQIWCLKLFVLADSAYFLYLMPEKIICTWNDSCSYPPRDLFYTHVKFNLNILKSGTKQEWTIFIVYRK